MKTVKYLFIIILAMLTAENVKAQQRNILQLPDVSVQKGNAQLPVNIENTDDITGIQFDLSLPDGITASQEGVMSVRGDGHSIVIRRLNSGAYRVLLYSAENRPLRGQTGLVMYIPINIPESFEEGSELQANISNATLGKASGENVVTDIEVGKITIVRLPDLTVKNIIFDKSEVAPGDKIFISWQVENVGQLPTGGGWTEQLSLVSNDDNVSKLIATTYYDEVLSPNGVVSRQAEITLPMLLGIDGQARVQVRIVPNEKTGEKASAQGNNTLTSESECNIHKILTFTLSPQHIVENERTRITSTIYRSGRWNEAETFNVTATSDSRIAVPSTVTIPAGQSGYAFYLSPTDNEALDDGSIVNISIEGNGYSPVQQQLLIEDNEYPDLKLTASKSVLTEGETFQLTVTTSRVSSAPIVVTLTSENAKRFSYPQTVTIPAGESSATIEVTATDDEVPSLDLSNAFTASAPNYNKAEVIVLLKDNDLPVLELQLTPTTVQESAGVVAVAGVLRRTTNTNTKITVKLTDDADGSLYFGNRTLVLDKGVEEVHFNFGPVDNALVDGDRTYTITAAVWLSSCSCGASGESAGYVTAQLRVLDNDGPALSLTSSLSTVKEGGKATLTVSRNTTDTSSSLTVTLSSDYEEGLTYDHTVTIPAGQQSATVEVTSAANSVQGDSHTAIFTAQTTGYATGTCYLMVTDQTLPDARISNIAADVTEAEVGTKAKFTIEVTNDGAAELPAGVAVKLYRRGTSDAVGTVFTGDALAIGGSLMLTKTITLPTNVGSHSYYAVVNQENKVSELSFTNNTSEDLAISTIAPFSVTVNTDKAVYNQGEKILISGQLTGNGTANTAVDLYIINEGARQVQSVTTDADGKFNYEWELYNLQSGHFIVGACYPNEGLKTEMASFDVYGLRRTDNSNIICDVINEDVSVGSVGISNPGNLNLSGCNVKLLSAPYNCEAEFAIPSIIKAGENVELSYTIKGKAPSTENAYSEVKAKVTTAEGATLDVTFYFYCRSARGKLVANNQLINTTITKGKSREYRFDVTNIGRGNTGQISLALPDFMKSLSGNTLPSLNQNDSHVILLEFTPTKDMQLNVPINGRFGINCENGDGTYVDFIITPVSSEKGTLVVDVCNENTYYTKEAPHVEGAEVIVSNPVTNQLVVQGTTGDDGLFTAVLPEGYYKLRVSAKNSKEVYTNNIFVDPERETNTVITLSLNTIDYSFNAGKTEIEDKYEVVTTVTYETNLPVPTVVITAPNKIDGDNMQDGESVLINVLLTNKGLITANNVELYLPEPTDSWSMTPLASTAVGDLAPQQTVNIPIVITKSPAKSRIHHRQIRKSSSAFFDACMAGMAYHYEWICGKDIKDNLSVYRMAIKTCAWSDIYTQLAAAFGGASGYSGDGNGGVGTPNKDSKKEYESNVDKENVGIAPETLMCDQLQSCLAEATLDCLFSFIPQLGSYLSHLNDLANASIEKIMNGNVSANTLLDLYVSLKRDLLLDDKFKILPLIDCLEDILECYLKYNNLSRRSALKTHNGMKKRVIPSWAENFEEAVSLFHGQISSANQILNEIYGDDVWYDGDDEEIREFLSSLASLPDTKWPLDPESMFDAKPSSISDTQYTSLIERINNTGNENVSDNKIIVDLLKDYVKQMDDIDKVAADKGYDSMADWFFDAKEKLMERIESSSSVCTSVSLKLKQSMTMTRQAIRGTLTVYNGHEEIAMEDVKLTLTATNKTTGQVATAHEFQINAESLEGFQGILDLGSGWALDANVTGTATVLFIPTKYAAPEEPAEWSFGGTLSYIDPFTGLEVTRELYPVTLTVTPSPELDMTYFMQRDVYGDDPLTIDVEEPMKPAEFALLINNKGNGDATNFRMVTQQPEIVENEKGLKIDFELISKQLNGEDAYLSFGKSIDNDFGTIPAHSQAYAQWWLQSSLLGHFTDYKVEANHITSYGNEDLSLLGDVTIKELIHGFDMPEGSLKGGPEKGRAFLVNDISDSEDLPDKLYFTNGETAEVGMAATATIERTSATTCLLTITPSAEGWNYGSLLDPTHGYAELKSIVRQSDNQELGNTRFWQTDRILLDGKEWLYENRLHFVDNFESTGAVTYVLTFDPVPNTVLEVASIATLPDEGAIAEEPIDVLTVDFNKEIDATTFTADDITFNVQGVKQDASQIGISTVDNKQFTLDMSSLNPTLSNGYYTLTVQTTDITDAEGFQGKTGKQVGWILFRGGLVQLLTSAWPENSGTVTRKTDDTAGARSLAPTNDANSAKYGSTVTLVAEAASGYEFANWTLNGEVVSNEAEYTTTALNDMNFVANFKKKQYAVNVKVNGTGGTTEGTATGIYEHGTEVAITAVPDEDYTLKGWTVNGEAVEGSTNSLTTTVDKPTDIEVSFLQEYYRQSLTLGKGWNWVSSYISEPLELHNLQPYANRIISQTDELINDPELGMVGGITELTAGQGYKIEASSRFTSTFRGHLYDTSTTPINLRKGWNWISYPYKEMAQIDVVGNADEGDFITSQTGFAEYAGGYWAGTLNTLTPGMGYLYKSMTDKQLAFNTSGMPKGRRLLMASVTTASEYGIDIHRYPNTMNITAQLYRDGTELSGNDYTIYAMTGDEIRGISQYVGGYHYLTVYGDESAEISFLIENNNTGARYMADEKLMFHSDVVGNRKVPFNFNINTVTGINQLDDCSCPMTVYTMEGVLISSEATLKTLTRLPKGIYIVNGQKRYVK